MSTYKSMSRRRFLTNSAIAAGSVAGAGALLEACNTSNAPATTSSGSVTLTVMYASGEFTKDYIAEFEKLNPKIKISFVEFDATRLNAMLTSGNPPDFVRGPAIGSANNNARGLALALDKYLASSSVLKTDDLLGINNAWRWDGSKAGSGSIYGICKDWSLDATLWYNGKLFDAARLDRPSETEPLTYDQLFTIAEKLTVKSGGKTKTYGLGTEWAWGVGGADMAMVAQQGGKPSRWGNSSTRHRV